MTVKITHNEREEEEDDVEPMEVLILGVGLQGIGS